MYDHSRRSVLKIAQGSGRKEGYVSGRPALLVDHTKLSKTMCDHSRREWLQNCTSYVRTRPNFVGSCSQNCHRLCIDTAVGGIYKIAASYVQSTKSTAKLNCGFWLWSMHITPEQSNIYASWQPPQLLQLPRTIRLNFKLKPTAFWVLKQLWKNSNSNNIWHVNKKGPPRFPQFLLQRYPNRRW